jgi:hypothetical protein
MGDAFMAEITPDPIMRIASGFMAAKHLFVACEIGIFENLAPGPATSTSWRRAAAFLAARSRSAPTRWRVWGCSNATAIASATAQPQRRF